MDSAIIPLIPLTNRSLKRQFERDAKKVVLPLEEVNTAFLYYLFDDECHLTYKSLYNQYLVLWENTIDEIVKTYQFKSVGIDRLWFARNYKPII